MDDRILHKSYVRGRPTEPDNSQTEKEPGDFPQRAAVEGSEQVMRPFSGGT